MPALTISLGGKMDAASIKGAFSGAESEARASAARIQRILQRDITASKRDAAKMPEGTYYRKIADQQIADKEESLNKVMTAQYRAAALKRIQIAEMETAARALEAQKRAAIAENEARAAAVEASVDRGMKKRNSRARAVADYEQRLADKAAGAEKYRAEQTAEQVEQARRNIRARALRRQRLQERMQGPDLDGSMRLAAGSGAAIAENEARAAAVEASVDRGMKKRNSRARAVADYEQRLADKAAGAEKYRAEQTAEQVEQARRNIRARALRRQRLQERMQGPDLDGSMRLAAGSGAWSTAVHSQFGAGQMQLIHSLRATFDSLVSGGNPFTIMMQQIPQIIQGLSMMKEGAMEFVKEILKMPVGPIGTVAGIVAGLAVGFMIAYQHAKALIDKLSGIKLPDFEPEYIALHLKKVNLLAESWKEVGRAVRKTIEDYNSAAAAAERMAVATKTQFDHRRKLLDIEKQTKLASAGTPVRKAQIEAEYRLKENALAKEERDKARADKETERKNLEAEGGTLMDKSGKLLQTIPGKSEEDQNVALNKQRLDAANEAASNIEKARNSPGWLGVNRRDMFRAYNAVSASPVTSKDLTKAEDQVLKDRAVWKKNYQDSVNRQHDHDEVRNRAADFKDRAEKSFTEAASIAMKNKDQEKTDKTTTKNADEEAKAQAALEMRQALMSSHGSGGGPRLDIERAGGFLGGPQVALLDVSKKQLDELRAIKAKLGGNGGGRRVNFGGAK